MQSLHFLKECFVPMKPTALKIICPFSVYLNTGKSEVVRLVKTISIDQGGERCIFLLLLHDTLLHLAFLQAFCSIGKEGKKRLKNICIALFQLSVIMATKARCSPFRQFCDCNSKWALSKQKQTIIPIKLFLDYTTQLPSLIWKMN